MRDALRGLTTRGRSFLAAAVASGIAAGLLGEKDLLRVTMLLAVLPLLAVWNVGRTRYQLACTRTLEPRRVPVGTTARVVLRLQNLSRLPTGTMLLEDRLPYALGSRPRLVLERLGAQRSSSVAYTVRADIRGRYEVGPLMVRLTDPFGLCELTRGFPTVDRLTVMPQVVPLDPIRLAGEYAGAGESRARSAAVHGQDDTATREYRYGDDLRRVHWRSTARTGELMVRREEQPWESRATILLDARGVGHRGEGPTASFEWAVSAVASIASHLRQSGYRLRVVSDAGMDVHTGEPGGEGLVLDHLAEIGLSTQTDVGQFVDLVRSGGETGGLMIGVFGLLTPQECDQLARLRGSGTTRIALCVDSTTWQSLSDQDRAEATAAAEASALGMSRAGWRVIRVRHGAKLPALWPQMGRESQGFALRATLAETVAGGSH
jgi:uncharacterized protein (DUF58 family)